MKIIKNYKQFILEKKTYDYGCIMFNAPVKNWNKVLSEIDSDDVYNSPNHGLENNPHITVLYGLHKNIDTNELFDYLKQIKPITVKINGIGLFENKNYDVVKYNVLNNSDLNKVRKEIVKFPHTTDYSNYIPHITIAYVNSGTGKKYTNDNVSFDLTLNEIVYSTSDGSTKHFKL